MMQSITGKIIFTGSFMACSSMRWERLRRISAGLHAQHVGDRDAQLLGLHHGVQEYAQVVDVGAF